MTQCKQSYEEIAIPWNVTLPTVVLQHHHCHVTRSQLSRYTVKTEMSKCQHCHVAFLQLLCKKNIITAVSQSQHCHVTNDIVSCHNVITTHYFVKMSPLSDHSVITVWPEYHHCHASLSLFNVMLYHKVSITMSPRPCKKKKKINTVMSQCCPCTVMSHCLYCQVTLLMSQCYHCHVQMSTLSPL